MLLTSFEQDGDNEVPLAVTGGIEKGALPYAVGLVDGGPEVHHVPDDLHHHLGLDRPVGAGLKVFSN